MIFLMGCVDWIITTGFGEEIDNKYLIKSQEKDAGSRI
jgi:hypothetical protein